MESSLQGQDPSTAEGMWLNLISNIVASYIGESVEEFSQIGREISQLMCPLIIASDLGQRTESVAGEQKTANEIRLSTDQGRIWENFLRYPVTLSQSNTGIDKNDSSYDRIKRQQKILGLISGPCLSSPTGSWADQNWKAGKVKVGMWYQGVQPESGTPQKWPWKASLACPSLGPLMPKCLWGWERESGWASCWPDLSCMYRLGFFASFLQSKATMAWLFERHYERVLEKSAREISLCWVSPLQTSR